MELPNHVQDEAPQNHVTEKAAGGPLGQTDAALSGDLEDRVRINVGGTTFLTQWTTLKKPSCSRLARLALTDKNYDSKREEFYFDRNSHSFGCILDLHRTGYLHISHDVCIPKFLEELDYWEVPMDTIAPCCWMRIREHRSVLKRLNQISRTMQSGLLVGLGRRPDPAKIMSTNLGLAERADFNPAAFTPSWIRRLRNSIWMFLEEPSSSIAAKVWLLLYAVLVCLSVFVLLLESHRPPRGPHYDRPNMTNTCPSHQLLANSSSLLMVRLDLDESIMIAEAVTNAVFTFDFIFRLISCPNWKRFLLGLLNWVDVISVMCSWIIIHVYFAETCSSGASLNFLNLAAALRSFRSFRVLRVLKVIRGWQIVTLALKASMWEICILCSFIFTGMLVFSTLIYYAEYNHGTFQDISHGFWWSIVTLTTVGYGDMYPVSTLGYIVGSACVILSMFATGLPIPIISANFNALRTIYQMRDDFLERKKELTCKLSNSQQATSSNSEFRCPACRTRIFNVTNHNRPDVSVVNNTG